MSYASAIITDLGRVIENLIANINIPISSVSNNPVTIYSVNLPAGSYSLSATISSIIASGFTPNSTQSIVFAKQGYQLLINGVVKHQTNIVTPYDNISECANLTGHFSSTSPILLSIVAIPMAGVTTINGFQPFQNTVFSQFANYNQGHNVTGNVSIMRFG